MTAAPNADQAAAIEDKPPTPEGYVRLTIDGIEVLAPKGEVVIRTCERLGIEIPRFCDHPLLDPIAACRQCLVEVEMGGRKMPKPQPSCAQTVAEGLVVHTQFSSEIALRAQYANLEFLLINHPLDCPMCDKGGECPLQNQDLQHGPGESRFHEAKRVFVKPVPISSEILLDRDRCVLCYRCTRFSEQIAGDPFIDMLSRGVQQQVGIGPLRPFQSYFSGNTIQICPVGALTSTAYRFRSRPFDLVSSPSICEHCAAGCAIRTDHRRNVVLRRLAGNDPQVNEEWTCDKGRFAFAYAVAGDRIDTPLLRGADGVLAAASWTDAMAAAAAGLAAARDGGGVGVLTGGRLTVSDAYAYAKFARLALSSNDIDFRARAHSAEEAAFLSARVVGSGPDNGGVTYAALEQAPVVLLVALEPEEECPILFLRLRKAARHSTVVAAVAPLRSRGLEKMSGRWLPATPGTEVAVLARLVAAGAGDLKRSAAGAGGTGTGNADAVGTGTGNSDAAESSIAALLAQPGAVVLVGERAAQAPGLLTAVGALADATGAALAWVPRRAGERGALDAGALPTLLPGGRPVDDPAARAEVESAWGAAVPTEPGRDLTAMLAAVAAGDLGGLLIGGVELDDLPDPAAARAAIVAAGFVVSLEVRASAITEMADVVFPVAAPAERSGAYLDWEGRYRPFDTALPRLGGLDDGRVLDTLGVEMDVDLFTQTPRAAEADRTRLGTWSGRRAPVPSREMPAPVHAAAAAPPLAADHVRLALSRMLLDGSRGEDGEPHLAGTARRPVVRISRSRAAALGVDPGDEVTVSGPAGSVTLPVAITEMVDDAVWLPGRTARRATGPQLGADVGDPVRITATVARAQATPSAVTEQAPSVPSSSSGGM